MKKRPGADPEREKDLVRRCIAHDRAAWDEFVATYSSYIYSAILHALRTTRRTFSQDDADDIFADVFLSMVERDFNLLRSFQWRCALRTWLWAVTRKRVARYFRKKGVKTVSIHHLSPGDGSEPWTPVSRETPGLTPHQELETEEVRKLVIDSMQDLGHRDRLCLNLYYFEGLSYREIADILSLEVNHVGLIIFRAKKRLEKKLEDRV